MSRNGAEVLLNSIGGIVSPKRAVRAVAHANRLGTTPVNRSLNRRDFLQSSTVVPLVALTSCGVANLPLQAAQAIKRNGGPKLKISLNAYSFTKALNDNIKGRGKGMTL